MVVIGGRDDSVVMPFRPALRPGAPLLRRSATHLQVGTSPGIVVADRPGLVPLLRLLDGVRDVDRLQELVRTDVPELGETVAVVLAEMRAIGAVVDGLPTHGAHRRRAGAEIGFAVGPGTSDLVHTVRSVLAAAGLVHLASTDPDLLVIASYGETIRGIYERAAVLGVDHLPVVIDEDRVRIGPLVRPGRTPCVGCHDLHRTDWDPAWPALLAQLGHRPPAIHPLATDPLTLHASAVELAAQILAHIDGRTPPTVGRCLVVGPAHDERATWPVAFHGRCACDLLNAA